MMHLRQPIVIPAGRPLRALIHARFSTEEQRPTSIDDQIASCRRFLDANLPKGTKPSQLAIDYVKEPEVSGEIADRPGINQVWTGIEAKQWDLIVAEESSRLYRHHTKAGELFESAVDAGVRVICPSDYIDTADEDWPDRLHMCQMQHSRSNFYVRKRIERALEGLWARGAAVGNTVVGYKRRPTVPSTETEPAKGPFYDEIDPEKVPVILEIFERIANGEPAWAVAEWLDSIKFAKASWATQPKWTTGNVNVIIRRTIYRGFETNRKKVAKRKLRTGKSQQVWNDEDKIQTRVSEHLRIVPDWLWYKANDVVDKRRVFQAPGRGAGHPLRGTTRDRKGLFSKVLVCGICGEPMYSYGAKDGSFRCSASAKGKCWNRVYCMRERMQPAVLATVVDAVLSLDGARGALLDRVAQLHQQGGPAAAELKALEKEQRKLEAAIERLGVAIEGGHGAVTSLSARLADREKDLAVVRSRLEELSRRAGRDEKLPGPAELLRHLESVKAGLGSDEGRAAVILRSLLDGPIRVVPFMRIDGKKVVPRLEFTLKLVNALPSAMAGVLQGDAGGSGDAGPAATAGSVPTRSFFLDVAFQPQLVRHATLILEQKRLGKTLKATAKELGMSEYNMDNAARIVKLMEEQGLTDPYIRLTDKPDKVSKWCSRHWRKTGQSKRGGRRRKGA
jgi:site-specific DNA recombinase